MTRGFRVGRPCIDWLIIGGESGPCARPLDLAWARSAVDQCKAAGVPAFVKQFGARPVDSAFSAVHDRHGVAWPKTSHEEAKRIAPQYDGGHVVRPAPVRLRHRKGADPSEWPADLRVRQFPGGAT